MGKSRRRPRCSDPQRRRVHRRVVELATRKRRELQVYPASNCSLNVRVALTEALSNAILRGNREDRWQAACASAPSSSDAASSSRSRTKAPASTSTPSIRDPPPRRTSSARTAAGCSSCAADGPGRALPADGNVVRLTLRPRMNELEAVLIAFREVDAVSTQPCGRPRLARPSRRPLRSSPAPARSMPDRLPDCRIGVRSPTNDGTSARRPRSRAQDGVARRRSVRRRVVRRTTSYLDCFCPVVDADPTRRARGRARRERARRALRGDQSPLHDQRDPRPHGVARGGAATILDEISETVGARRASILVHEPATDTLRSSPRSASDGTDAPADRASTTTCSVSARVFRTQHPRSSPRTARCTARPERPYRRGAMLSVPIMWTAPDGGEPLGVVNLSDRRSRPAVHRRRPEARRGDRDADRHRDPERAARARVDRAAAPAAGDAARARPADEAPARHDRSSRRKRASRRASFPPRASAATSTISSAVAAGAPA